MRLLELHGDGELRLTEFGSDTPPYAILSHTWGADEITFREFTGSINKSKAGYKKIRFCAEQAAKDGLHFFWVDTCCTIQTHHRRQRPTKRVAYAAENGGIMHIAFPYKIRLFTHILSNISSQIESSNEGPKSGLSTRG
jgi:hypothetical protein